MPKKSTKMPGQAAEGPSAPPDPKEVRRAQRLADDRASRTAAIVFNNEPGEEEREDEEDDDVDDDNGAMVMDRFGNTVPRGSATDPEVVRRRAERFKLECASAHSFFSCLIAVRVRFSIAAPFNCTFPGRTAARAAAGASGAPLSPRSPTPGSPGARAPAAQEDEDRAAGPGGDDKSVALLAAKQAAGGKLSNKERKLVKKHEERQARAAQQAVEDSDPLRFFSVVVPGGRTTDDGAADGAVSATDVVLPCFSISAPARTLFVDASLRLASGRRYGKFIMENVVWINLTKWIFVFVVYKLKGLLGPNGRGKSTLLQCLAARKLPVPRELDALLVQQEVCHFLSA
jgi:hypothetical protein